MTSRTTPVRAVFALIPMKPFAVAKSRLRGDVPDAARQALALAMFERVVSAAKGCAALQAVAVLTYGEDVALCASQAGAHVLRDVSAAAGTLGALVDAALPQLSALGADAVVVLMADLPYLESRDIVQLVEGLSAGDVVIAADARGASTNALAVRLPAPIAAAFGHQHSYAQHRERAHGLGLIPIEIHNPRLAHDVDIRDDLPEDATWAGAGIFPKLEPKVR